VNVVYRAYFKQKGNRGPKFFDKINGAFVCLVAAILRHCLKSWITGEYAESSPEFKYETAWCEFIGLFAVDRRLTGLGIYKRLTKLWEIHSAEVQELILHNIKADLARRIRASITLVWEPTEVPEVEDEQRYRARLRKDLEDSLNKLSQLRDSSVERDDPLEPSVDSDSDGVNPSSSDDEL
jgi:hypothetical protein